MFAFFSQLMKPRALARPFSMMDILLKMNKTENFVFHITNKLPSEVFQQGIWAKAPGIDRCPYENITSPKKCNNISTTFDWIRYLTKTSRCTKGDKVHIYVIDLTLYPTPGKITVIDYDKFPKIDFYRNEGEIVLKNHIPIEAIVGHLLLCMEEPRKKRWSVQSGTINENYEKKHQLEELMKNKNLSTNYPFNDKQTNMIYLSKNSL